MIKEILSDYFNFFDGKTMESIVLNEGTLFTSQPFDSKKYPFALTTKKKCYKNAFHLVLDNTELTYCEGFALPNGIPIPIHHAWAIDSDGNVVDPTWDDSEKCEYYGIEIPTEKMVSTVTKNGVYGVITTYREWLEYTEK